MTTLKAGTVVEVRPQGFVNGVVVAKGPKGDIGPAGDTTAADASAAAAQAAAEQAQSAAEAAVAPTEDFVASRIPAGGAITTALDARTAQQAQSVGSPLAGAIDTRVGAQVTPLQSQVNALAVSGTLTPQGAWSSATAYAARDIVTDAGVSYVAKTAIAAGGAAPASDSNWQTLGTSVDATARTTLANATLVSQDIGDVPGWDSVTTTADGWVVDGAATDGTQYARYTTTGLAAVDAGDLEVPGWAHLIHDPSGVYVLGGVDSTGRPYLDGLSVRVLDAPGLSSRVPAAACFGDSQFDADNDGGGSVDHLLGLALGLPVFEGGISSQTTSEVVLRMGALEMWASVTGGSIPATGSVGLTLVTEGVWKVGELRTYDMTAVLADGTQIPGTLTKDTTEAWTFTPLAGLTSAVPAPREIVFKSTQAAQVPDAGVLMWCGRNNLNVDPNEIDIIVRDYKLARSYVYAQQTRPRFLAIPVYNSTDAPAGVGEYDHLVDIWAALEDAMEADYYDLRRWLIHNGLDAAGITPTAQDLTDIANDVTPTSLRLDGGAGLNHRNIAGRTAEAAQLAYVLTTRGWFQS